MSLSPIFTPKRGVNRHFPANYSNLRYSQNYCNNFNPWASKQGEQGHRLLPNFWGAGAVLPHKFVTVTVTEGRWYWRLRLFTGGSYHYWCVSALYPFNKTCKAVWWLTGDPWPRMTSKRSSLQVLQACSDWPQPQRTDSRCNQFRWNEVIWDKVRFGLVRWITNIPYDLNVH